jgi:hypothetical protein
MNKINKQKKLNDEQKVINHTIYVKVFENKGHFMEHKKSEHSECVQMFTSVNSCQYQNCWFRHEHNERNTDKQEVTEKILSMMEKFTQRIVKLENLINK